MTKNTIIVAFVFASTVPGVSAGEILHDNLCITDEKLYGHYPFNICGGTAYFGDSENWQLADRFVISQSYWITSATVDYATVYGVPPDWICARFYAGGSFAGCGQPETLKYCGEKVFPDSFDWEPFDLEGFNGRRATTHFSTPCLLPEGGWYLSMQLITEQDVAATLVANYSQENDCVTQGCLVWRWGDQDGPCCVDQNDPLWDATDPEPDTLSMRVEGIPTGDCVGGERVWAKCKVRDGGRRGRVVVKVGNGQPNGTVTALLDPPDPQSLSIALDGSGRGKGKFRDVPLGEHRVFVCDSIVDVACAP